MRIGACDVVHQEFAGRQNFILTYDFKNKEIKRNEQNGYALFALFLCSFYLLIGCLTFYN